MDSATLKVDRATEHIRKLSELLREKRCFFLSLKTNTKANERWLSVVNDKAVTQEAGLIAGDAVHNLRSALDHVYWEFLEPHRAGKEDARIQFPFSYKREGFGAALVRRYAVNMGTAFVSALVSLKPYKKDGGDELLYAIHDLDIADKHKLLIPAIGHTDIPFQTLKQAVPDWPGPVVHQISLHNWPGRFTWAQPSPPGDLGRLIPGTVGMFERQLDIPVDVVLEFGSPVQARPVVPLLNDLTNVCLGTIAALRARGTGY